MCSRSADWGSPLRLETRQDVEDHQRDDALPVRRAFMHPMAPETGVDGIDIFTSRVGEVVQRVDAAETAQVGDDVVGDSSGVEAVTSFRRDTPQRGAKLRLAMHLAHAWRASARQEDTACGRVRRQQLGLEDPVAMNAR